MYSYCGITLNDILYAVLPPTWFNGYCRDGKNDSTDLPMKRVDRINTTVWRCYNLCKKEVACVAFTFNGGCSLHKKPQTLPYHGHSPYHGLPKNGDGTRCYVMTRSMF